MIGKERNYIGECPVSSEGKLGGLEDIRFTVYGRPYAKQRPRFSSKGKRKAYTPSVTKTQETKIALVYKSHYHGFKFAKGVPLRIVVDAFVAIPKSTTKRDREKMLSGELRPVKRILDADNATKLAMDALNGVAYYDDAQIVEETGRKFYSDNPRTEIYIAVVGEKHEE